MPPQRTWSLTAADGVHLHAACFIPANPRAVVLLVHGLGEHLGRYAAWAQRFTAVGTAVCALDLRGHGQSGGKRGHTPSFKALIADVKSVYDQVLNEFAGLPVFLYGHSMGGAVILAFAQGVQPTVAGIITTGPAIAPGFAPPPVKVMAARCLDLFVPGLALSNELDPNEISTNKEVVAAYCRDPLVHDRISVRWYNDWMRAVAKLATDSPQIPRPILMIHGAADKLTSPSASRALATQLQQGAKSGVTYESWPNARHELHHEPAQAEIFLAIYQWMQQQVPALAGNGSS